MKVGVIDYGVGNLGSVMRALEDLRVAPSLVTYPQEMRSMDSLILPGVGNFGDCARLLVKGGWFDALTAEVGDGRKSLLGVCLGMQLLASRSVEGAEDSASGSMAGLGLVPGRVERLSSLGCNLRVPHIKEAV
jgi:glutamine amidotransferase